MQMKNETVTLYPTCAPPPPQQKICVLQLSECNLGSMKKTEKVLKSKIFL